MLWPCAAYCRTVGGCQGKKHSVFSAFKSHHDESVRPNYFWSCGVGAVARFHYKPCNCFRQYRSLILNLGLSDLEQRLAGLPAEQRSQLERDLAATLANQPRLYMVDSDRGISNLHVSSDVIIDASMPALIRAGGRAWGPDGLEADCKCVIQIIPMRRL